MKQRFEVYVCTAAERGYALEAWRILDPKVRRAPSALRLAEALLGVCLCSSGGFVFTQFCVWTVLGFGQDRLRSNM